MSVSTELTRISNAVSDIKTAISNKGVTVPVGTKIDGLAQCVANIPSGSGVDVSGDTVEQMFVSKNITFHAPDGTAQTGNARICIPETCFQSAYGNGTHIDIPKPSNLNGRSLRFLNVILRDMGDDVDYRSDSGSGDAVVVSYTYSAECGLRTSSNVTYSIGVFAYVHRVTLTNRYLNTGYYSGSSNWSVTEYPTYWRVEFIRSGTTGTFASNVQYYITVGY